MTKLKNLRAIRMFGFLVAVSVGLIATLSCASAARFVSYAPGDGWHAGPDHGIAEPEIKRMVWVRPGAGIVFTWHNHVENVHINIKSVLTTLEHEGNRIDSVHTAKCNSPAGAWLVKYTAAGDGPAAQAFARADVLYAERSGHLYTLAYSYRNGDPEDLTVVDSFIRYCTAP